MTFDEYKPYMDRSKMLKTYEEKHEKVVLDDIGIDNTNRIQKYPCIDTKVSMQKTQKSSTSMTLRRSTRQSRPTQRNFHYLLLTDNEELEHYFEALHVRNLIKWEKKTKKEMNSLMKNKM